MMASKPVEGQVPLHAEGLGWSADHSPWGHQLSYAVNPQLAQPPVAAHFRRSDGAAEAEEEMSVSGKKNYLSCRAKSVSSPMAELAFLSEKSRNDTRASNNLQTYVTPSGWADLQLTAPPTRGPGVETREESAPEQSELKGLLMSPGSPTPCPPQQGRYSAMRTVLPLNVRFQGGEQF